MAKSMNDAVSRSAGAAIRFAAFCLIIAMMAPARGQDIYRTVFSEGFEGGAFPAGFERIHKATEANVAVVDYAASGAPAELLQGAAAKECGRYGLRLAPGGEARVLSVIHQTAISRSSIPPGGRAVIQCDIFAANPPVAGLNAAVLALNEKEESKRNKTWQFYRFGLSTTRAFFSFMNIQERPLIYVEDEEWGKGFKRPGWRRFQIGFDGEETISLAVDGVTAPFSPMRDKTLKALHPGVIITGSSAEQRTLYVDNLSAVITSASNAGWPASPWPPPPAALPDDAAGNNKQPWLLSPEAAWGQCQSSKRPILVLFYNPQAIWLQSLEKIMNFDPSAQKMLQNFILLKVDVKQPAGAQLAARFGVVKTPCFVILGANGKELDRTALTNETPWPQVYDVLKKYVAAIK